MDIPNEPYNPTVTTTGYMHIVPSFKSQLKCAMEQGLLLFVKYALVLVLSYVALQFGLNVISGSQNGTSAVLYLKEAQDKGYLPKVVNGQLPPKMEQPNAQVTK